MSYFMDENKKFGKNTIFKEILQNYTKVYITSIRIFQTPKMSLFTVFVCDIIKSKNSLNIYSIKTGRYIYPETSGL